VTKRLASSPPPATPAYVADIHQQPQALQQLLDSAVDPAALNLLRRLSGFSRVILTGMGASLYAQYPAYLTLASAGLPVWHVEASELLGGAAGLVTTDTLLWITSQSGRSAEITALLDRLPGRRPVVLGFTNDTASPLAGSADEVIVLHSGDEHTVGTRSYVNSLAAHLRAVAAALGRETAAEVYEMPARLADYLSGWPEHYAAWDATVAEQVLFAVGRGASLAAARTGALIVKEAAKTPMEAASASQFRHGPLEMADSRTCVIVLPGAADDAPLNGRLATDLSSFGANAVMLAATGHPGGPQLPAARSDETRPLGEILPFQVLSVVLAERRGLEPGAFRQIGKVTTTL
jgi:glucosamine--fructose-6-phosphate aminotransferase (isomerizing)